VLAALRTVDGHGMGVG
jgi:hypothetical protein